MTKNQNDEDGKVRLYSYELQEQATNEEYLDYLRFYATSLYDSKKGWYDQYGEYDCDANSKIHMNVRMMGNKIRVGLSLSGGESLQSEVPISDTFKLIKEPSGEILNCTISNVNNGHLTLSTTGADTGTYEMSFRGYAIYELFKRI